jgi:hypothetical protein
MIRKVLRDPAVEWCFDCVFYGEIGFQLLVGRGTTPEFVANVLVPMDAVEPTALAQLVALQAQMAAVRKERADRMGSLSTKRIDALWAEGNRLFQQSRSLCAGFEYDPKFTRIVTADAAILRPLNDRHQKFYAFKTDTVWCCGLELSPAQWNALIDQQLVREQEELAAALAGCSDSDNRRIGAEVRRAVWKRDGGQCAKCGSREALEFDHIVPVSKGGSNTERNIELLCEVCNRRKSSLIG